MCDLRTGCVLVRVHSASLDSSPRGEEGRSSLFCVAEIAASGRHRTSETESSAGGSDGVEGTAVYEWEESLAFVVGPSDRAQHLKLVLCRPSDSGSGSGEFVAAGSLGLDPLLESHTPRRHQVSVPVVDDVGRHAGEVCATLSLHISPQAGAESGAVAGAAAAAAPQALHAVHTG